ncbi:MAG: succinate dehydrogenase cytochrome b subunit [Bacteroidales bacterium]|jgi:succinate dehydrogenase / fumarate reductase cytochrome b subunit
MENAAFIFSSIGKKFIVAVAGAFLMIFLCVHLTVNLFLLAGDDGKLFNIASHFMGTNFIIQKLQWLLAIGFILHMFYAAYVTVKNWLARPVGYRVRRDTETSFFSRYMIHTGIIVFIFICLHLMNFFYKIKFTDMAEYEYNHFLMVSSLFKQQTYSIVYVVALLILGFHLNHAFQSAFQTLGFNHNKYTPAIKAFGVIYAIIIAGGFIAIPIYFMFF